MGSAVTNIWDSAVSTRLTPRQATETLYEHRLRLEDDVGHLERALSIAKRLRNSSAPILTLPDEILLEIFLTLRNLFYSDIQQTPKTLLSSSWLAVAVVCSRFRGLATTSPTLHTRLSTRTLHKDCVERELLLSSPLDLSFDAALPRSELDVSRVHDYLSAHGHRVRTFNMQLIGTWASLVERWMHAVPHLRTLVMSAKTGNGHSWSTDAVVTFGPSITTLMPELSSLHIDGVYLELTSHIFINLTELSLGHIAIGNTSLKSLFRRTRKLRKLYIHTIWLTSIMATDTDISLPEPLCYLEVTTSASLLVFHYFVPSPSVRVKIVQMATPTDLKDSTRRNISNKILTSWLRPDSPPTVVDLTIRYNTVAAEACVAYWRDSHNHAAGLEPDFEFIRYVDEDFGVGDLLLGPIYDHVTHLSFDVDWDFPLFCDKGDWLHALGPLLNLRSVIFAGPRTLAPALPHLTRWPQHDSTTLWRPYQLFTEVRASMGDVNVLIDWLAKRKSRGLPLQRLTVPVHVGVALDEAVVAEGPGTTNWRALVSDVHLDYNI